jgi:hypothetical protein
MYSLIMGAVDGVLPVERLLEGIDAGLDSFLRPGGTVDVARLLSLPALLMPEIGDTRSAQIARVGNVVSLVRSGRDWHFRFIRNDAIPDISSERIEALAIELGIGRYGFTRTRWTVNAPDLYQVLFQKNVIGVPRPTAFSLPVVAPELNRIAVMMPFSAEFASVWATLKAAADNGAGCANGPTTSGKTACSSITSSRSLRDPRS